MLSNISDRVYFKLEYSQPFMESLCAHSSPRSLVVLHNHCCSNAATDRKVDVLYSIYCFLLSFMESICTHQSPGSLVQNHWCYRGLGECYILLHIVLLCIRTILKSPGVLDFYDL